jgi:hypothetical protein
LFIAVRTQMVCRLLCCHLPRPESDSSLNRLCTRSVLPNLP